MGMMEIGDRDELQYKLFSFVGIFLKCKTRSQISFRRRRRIVGESFEAVELERG